MDVKAPAMVRVMPVHGLSDVAAHARSTRAHLARSFRALFACPIGEYVRAVRLERAAQCLRESDRSPAQLATELGFFDQAHFTRVFHARCGVTPAAWRRANN